MARAMIDLHDLKNTAPDWAGYFIDHDKMLPAGGQIDVASVPATNGIKYVPSGTVVGRTQAQIDADAPFTYLTAGAAGPFAQVYIVVFEVENAERNADIELLRPHAGAIVKWNFLPDQAVVTARRADLENNYVLVKGV